MTSKSRAEYQQSSFDGFDIFFMNHLSKERFKPKSFVFELMSLTTTPSTWSISKQSNIVITLDGSNQSNFFENATAYSKRTLKTNVATRWLAQTKVITLKTQLHALNACWNSVSQCSLTYIIDDPFEPFVKILCHLVINFTNIFYADYTKKIDHLTLINIYFSDCKMA